MRTLFVVDPLDGLDASLDTSIGLMHAAQELGVEVWATEARGLEVRRRPRRGVGPCPQAGALHPGGRVPLDRPGPLVRRGTRGAAAAGRRATRCSCASSLRSTWTSSRRPTCSTTSTPAATAMVNAPGGLRACSEHLLGLSFPDLVPPTVVTAHGRHDPRLPGRARAHRRQAGRRVQRTRRLPAVAARPEPRVDHRDLHVAVGPERSSPSPTWRRSRPATSGSTCWTASPSVPASGTRCLATSASSARTGRPSSRLATSRSSNASLPPCARTACGASASTSSATTSSRST